MKIDIELSLPQDAESVAIVRDVTVDALRRIGVSVDSLADVRLALSEACTNVLKHSDADDNYVVSLRIENTRCDIRVIDDGHSIDRTEAGNRDPMATGGRGLAIMRALSDQLSFTSEPDDGTVVHMVMHLSVEADGALARLTDA